MDFIYRFQISKDSFKDFFLLLNRITKTVAKGDEFKDIIFIANIYQDPKDIKAE